MLSTGLRTGIRRFTTSAIMRSKSRDPRPGSNIPFGLHFKKRYAFTLGYTLFFSSAMTMPFLLVRQSNLK